MHYTSGAAIAALPLQNSAKHLDTLPADNISQ